MRVRYGPRADRHLGHIFEWIAEHADSETAGRIVSELLARCDALATFPRRGTQRDDISPGLRTIVHRRRYMIGYIIVENEVVIVGVLAAGQDTDVLTGAD